MGRRLAALLTFGLVSSCSVFTQVAPPQNVESGIPTFHTQATEVQLTFSATDQNNRVVATLNASDFAVVDKDFIVRNFRSFSRADYTHLDVAILLDNSSSTAPRFQQEIAQTLDLLSQTSGAPEEGISVVSFHGAQPTMVCKGNCRSQHAAKLIFASSQNVVTPLFDSLAFTAAMLSQSADRKSRKVIILLSDGEDTISRSSASEAVSAVVANDVHVYTLDANTSNSSRGSRFLRDLAAATGGESFRLNDGAVAVADAVLTDFHATYQVTYLPPYPDAGFHNVRIVPTHTLNLTFRCRQGYIANPGR